MISCCVPCYNHSPYLPTLFQSLLDSTYKDIQLLISDDASTDSSGEIIKEWYPRLKEELTEVKYFLHPENLGLQGRNNTKFVVSQSTGECLCVLEGDDYIHPLRFEKQLALLKEKDGVACHADIYTVDRNDKVISESRWAGSEWWLELGEIREQLEQDNRIMTCSFLCKTDVYKEAFDYDLFTSWGILVTGDWLGFLRIAKQHKIWYDKTPLAYYRTHPGSHSQTQRQEMIKDKYRIHELISLGLL